MGLFKKQKSTEVAESSIDTIDFKKRIEFIRNYAIEHHWHSMGSTVKQMDHALKNNGAFEGGIATFVPEDEPDITKGKFDFAYPYVRIDLGSSGWVRYSQTIVDSFLFRAEDIDKFFNYLCSKRYKTFEFTEGDHENAFDDGTIIHATVLPIIPEKIFYDLMKCYLEHFEEECNELHEMLDQFNEIHGAA